MLKHIFKFSIIMCVLFLQNGYSQTVGNPSLSKETPIYIEGFDYPSFDPISNYAFFKIHFPLTTTTEFSVGGEHYRNYMADRFTIPIQFKKYFNEKSYLIGGYQQEWDLLNRGRGRPNPKPMQEVFFGIGNDIRPNWFMEAKMVQPISKKDFYKVGLEGVRTRLEVGTKLKF